MDLPVLLFVAVVFMAVVFGIPVLSAHVKHARNRDSWRMIATGKVIGVLVDTVPAGDTPNENGQVCPPVSQTVVSFVGGKVITLPGDQSAEFAADAMVSVYTNALNQFRVQKF